MSIKNLTPEQIERLADEALGIEPDASILHAGSCETAGFGTGIAKTRERASQLVAFPRDGEETTDELEWQRKRVFLQSLSMTNNVAMAAGAAGWTRIKAQKAKKEDKLFAEAWNEAVENAGDFFEAEMVRRAVHGVEKAVWHKGEVVGYETQFSDSLLQTLIKGAKPEKYRERTDVKKEVTKRQGVLRLPPKVPQEEYLERLKKNQSEYRESNRDDS